MAKTAKYVSYFHYTLSMFRTLPDAPDSLSLFVVLYSTRLGFALILDVIHHPHSPFFPFLFTLEAQITADQKHKIILFIPFDGKVQARGLSNTFGNFPSYPLPAMIAQGCPMERVI